jgi:hypothetical protein
MDPQVEPAGDDQNLRAEYPALSAWARRRALVAALPKAPASQAMPGATARAEPKVMALQMPEATVPRRAAPQPAVPWMMAARQPRPLAHRLSAA